MSFWKNASMGFASGALGGLICGLLFWAAVTYGLAGKMNVSFSVPSDFINLGAFLTQFIIWGAICGFLLLVPLWKSAWIKRGLLLGLVPALVFLLYIFPYRDGGGMFAMNHGNFAFAFILIAAWIYSLITSIWYHKIS